MDWGVRTMTLVLWMLIGLSAISNCNGNERIVCYYTNWSVYRPGTAKYSPQNINPYLCTHLIYAFGGFTKDNTLKPFDKYQDIEKGGYAKFTGLKTYNKNLKTMLAIGGWNEGSSRFSPMVADPDRRRELVKNSVKFLRQNHFDGLDLDWEYPAFRDGGKSRDKDNYADLVQELREEFERESSKTGRPRLLLSMAIPAGIGYLEKGYDLPRLNEYLDFFNLLSYDYHSAFEPAVNHHAPLYGLEEANEYNYDSELTIDYTMNYLLSHDVTPEKIVLGIPTYGRSYTLYNAEATDIGAPADGPGEEGDATREKGYLAYYEICENIAKSDEWEVVQPNEKAMGPYAYRENQWVGYDDENIVRVKALYVREKKLGGIMFWSIDNDDFRGKCHGRPYPLIEAAKEALLSGNERAQEKQKPLLPRKKTRPQSTQRTTESPTDRKYSSPRRSGSKPTRKRLSSSRSTPTPEDSPESPPEDRDTPSRTRASHPKTRNGSRRREQTRKIERTEESSLSNSLTTPEPPTTPDPGSDFKCEDEGFFSHPRDCKKYFWCLDSGPSGLGIVAHQFTCPSGLVFNKAADSCDYPRNVICPKVKASSETTTTAKPVMSRTTKRTTTTEQPESEEEYEYEDDEVNAAEEKEEEPVSTTAKTLLYKTISRSRPTTTSTTSTKAITEGTPEVSRGFKGDEGDEDTEDPKVLKELIDLIKKAGGIEELEKQLHLQERGSGGDTTEGSLATPATISRSLYERVLNRQATKLFAGAKDTKQVVNSRSSFQNGPGRSQFEGLDEVPEVKNLRRTNKYVTIARQRPSTNEPPVDENGKELADEEIEEDNDDVASSDARAVSNLPEEERNSSPKRVTPNYVNIRRSRPTTPASEEEPLDTPSSTESIEEVSQESTPKSRYTSINRFRSTTTVSTSSEDSPISSEEPPETSPTPLELTTEVFSTPSPSPTTEYQKPSTSSLPEVTNPTISTTHQPATEPIKQFENSVTEILTTIPAQSSPRTTPSPRTTASAVSPPRPFGFSRRTRPTPSASSTTTEQTRVKVNLEIPELLDKPGLPTLKQLIDTNYEITKNGSVEGRKSYDGNSLNDEIDNKVPQIIDSDGIKVRVKILDDYGSGEVKINQFAVLSLPQGAINSNITNTVLKIEVINNSGDIVNDYDEDVEDNQLSRRRRVEDKNVNVESQTRSSRGRGTVRQQSTTPHWTNSRRRNVRRRGNSRVTYVDQNTAGIINTSSTTPISIDESVFTTLEPTTLRGSSLMVHRTDEPIRGFFITKSLDEVPRVTGKIDMKGFTTEIPLPSTTSETISTTMKQDEDSTKFGSSGSFEEFSNEVDGRETTTLNEVTTTFRSVETTYDQGRDDDVEVTTVKPEVTTYHPLKIDKDEELEIDTEIYLNDEESDGIQTTPVFNGDTTIYDEREKLNKSNFARRESEEEYTSESYNNGGTVFTTPRSFSTVEDEINDELREISTGFEGTTHKIEVETTAREEMTSTTRAFETILTDEIDENKTTLILKIIPFTREDQNEENSSPTVSSQALSTEEMRKEEITKIFEDKTTETPQITPLTPEDDRNPNPTASNLEISSSTHATSPLIRSGISTTPMSTSHPETPPKRTRTDIRSRGRIRYQQSSSTSAPRERKPRPSSSNRRRPTPKNHSESSETTEESPSPQQPLSTSSSVTIQYSTPSRHRTVYRGRGRKQTTSTTTEQSFPPTESPEDIVKNEEVNLNTGPIKEDDLIIAESSHADVLGEVGSLRKSGNFLRRPGSIVRPTSSKSYSIEYETADRRYSSKVTMPKTESSDQSTRAQEVGESLVDPSGLTSLETGTSIYRGGQRHKTEEFKGITEIPITRTTAPRRRQRPISEIKEAKAIPKRPRRPAIIDYDYYVDEEVRISVKPELKNKIYVTSSGRIGCLDQGTFAHPFSCKKFITCAMMVGGKVIPTEYSCPSKLSFDPVGGICNWSAGLGCKESL